MTRPYSDRGQGRKALRGDLLQVNVRVLSDDEAETIVAMQPRERAQALLAHEQQRIQFTGKRLTMRLIDPMPCAIRADDGTCGKPAYAAYADEVIVSGRWATPGQWLLQPICEDCTKKIMEVYK
jgi:hypothetical protein